MSSKAMSLKAKIKNLAKEKNMSAQVVLQNYMFERFLERLSKSTYKDKFILKGGILIASIVGIDQRATMDMDATLKNFPMKSESILNAMIEICDIELDDHVKFSFLELDAIRKDDFYGGFRGNIRAVYDSIITSMQIDITTGDAITPREIHFKFKKILEEGHIEIWAYNIETVLAEKVETILKRGELNTRPRDFYDVYILTKTQTVDRSLFLKALHSTVNHRNSMYILTDIDDRIEEIKRSNLLKPQWIKYTKDYPYADNLSYDHVIQALELLVHNSK